MFITSLSLTLAQYHISGQTGVFYKGETKVLLGIGGWPLGYTKSENVGLIVRAISFQDFQLM